MTLDLLERLQAATNDEERAWIVTELALAALDPAVREAVWAAAIPHWFDADFLAALLARPVAEVGPIHAQLTGLSFVERFPERGHDIHERTRALLLNRLWRDDAARFRLYSGRAADHCAGQDQAATGWCVETIYHLLIADPEQGASALQNQGWTWHNSPHFAYDKVEMLARVGREHADASRLSPRGLGWTQFWEALLDSIYSRLHSARERFQQIRGDPKDDPYLAADVAFRLGDVHLQLADYPAARAAYDAARPLYAAIGDRLGEANCIYSLGDVSLGLADYPAARTAYATARPIYAAIGDRLGEANCIQRLGDVSLGLTDYPAARTASATARPLYAAIGARLGEANCIYSLGDVSLRLADYPAARTAYATARPLYAAIGDRLGEANCIKALGHVSLAEEDYDAARAAFEDAANRYHGLGARNDEAGAFSRLADIFSDQKLYREAANMLSRAIEIIPDYAMWYRNRANHYINAKDFSAAAADLARAAELQPDHPYLALRRGDLALKQGQYAAAAGHYQQFITGLPKVNFGHFGLGLALICLGQATEGMAEIRQALALTYAPREVKGFGEELAELIAAEPARAGLAEALALVEARR